MRLMMYVCALCLAIGIQPMAAGETARQYKVMTYNVLYGAGVEAQNEQIANRASKGKYHGNRLEQVISVIKYVNPDIVGIQEACAWDKDGEAAAKRVASELGMNYFVGKSARSRFNVALFSKFPIVSAKTFPEQFSRAAIEAELKLPDGRVLHAFVGHFNPNNKTEQLQEIRFLAAQMWPYAFDLAVMMADSNMSYQKGSEKTDALRASGFLLSPSIKGIDQVWTSRPLSADVKVSPNLPPELTSETSDHSPTVVVISTPPVKAEGAF